MQPLANTKSVLGVKKGVLTMAASTEALKLCNSVKKDPKAKSKTATKSSYKHKPLFRV